MDGFYNGTFEIASYRKIKMKDTMRKLEEMESAYGVNLKSYKYSYHIFDIKTYRDFSNVKITKKFKYKHLLSYGAIVDNKYINCYFSKGGKYYDKFPVKMSPIEFHKFTKNVAEYRDFQRYKRYMIPGKIFTKVSEVAETGMKTKIQLNLNTKITKTTDLYLSRADYLYHYNKKKGLV